MIYHGGVAPYRQDYSSVHRMSDEAIDSASD